MIRRKLPTLTVKQTGKEDQVVDPGGSVTFHVPFTDKMSDASTRIEFKGSVQLTLYWDGKVLSYFAPEA